METQVIGLLLRWLHFFAAIVWMGHNYSTLIQRPSWQPLLASDLVNERSPRFQSLLQREHAIFRWASVVALGTGLAMLALRGTLTGALTLQGYEAVMGIGLWIGVVMTLNVWLVLWPNQKKVLGFISASVDERLRSTRITFLSARVNTLLSIPLIFFMAAYQHGGFLFA